ncbi:Fc.00g026380.m01.CDS01 [Cosmosporella sp. VM-42]
MAAYTLVSNCTVDDAAGLSKSNMSAFWQNTWWNMLWVNQDLDSIIASATLRMPKVLLTDRIVRRHQKIVHSATGDIVGYARWILPDSHASSWLEAQVPDVSEMEKTQFEEAYAGAVWNLRPELDVLDEPILEMQRKHEPKRLFMKLDYLGVRPDHQRHGVASMLVKSGIHQADELGVDIYLVAMGANAADVYKKHQFELLDSCFQDLEPWGASGIYETHVLVKHPSK